MRHAAGAGGQGARRGAGRLDGEMARATVARRHRHDHVCLIEVVHGLCNQVLESQSPRVRCAAQAEVGDVESVGVSALERIEDVFGARILHSSGEHIVVAEQDARRHPGNSIRNGHAIDDGRGLEVAARRAGHVCSVRVNRLGGQSLPGGLVVEHFCGDDFVVGEALVTQPGLRRIPGVIEARVTNVDPGIDDGDPDFHPGIRRTAGHLPGFHRLDQAQVGIVGVLVVDGLVIGRLDQRRLANRFQAGAVKFHGDRVQRNFEFPRHFGLRRIGAQPGFEVIARGGQPSAIGSHRVTVEIDFLAWRRPGPGARAQRIPLQLHQRAARVNGGPGS